MLYGAHRPLAASARARRLGRSVGGEARAGRQGRARRGGIQRCRTNNRVMFQGDEVAAVAADTEEHAIDAARLVKVEYEVLPHVTDVEQALAGKAPEVFTGGNVRQGQTQETGDLAAGFKAAAHTIEETYATHVITHVCLESHGTVCEWDGDKLTAWISTQGINGARENFATALKIPQANVRVICQYMGGGFGSKALSVGAEGLICARLAKEANAPVKLMLDRKEEHLATGNRPSADRARQSRRVRRRHHHGVRRRVVGHGRRRRVGRLPAAVHLSDRESPPDAQGRVHQHGSAAADARARPSAGLVPHRDHDGRARRQGESGSGRVPDQEPAARGAERDVAVVSARGRRGIRLGQAASDRRQDARTDQDRHGRRDLHVGRRRPRPGAGALRNRVRRQRRHADRDAGHRHRHADARRDRHRRFAGTAAVAGQSGDRRHALRRQPDLGRQHDGREHQPGDSRRRDQGARRAEGEGRAGARRRCGVARRRGRPHSRQGQPVARACRGPTRASRLARSRSRSMATGCPACRR